MLEIAATTWEGTDYIADVIDDWLAPGAAPIVTADANGLLVGFARVNLPARGYAWFEGLRLDPAWQGRGVARAIMGAQLALVRTLDVDRIGASTYLDNAPSQHILEAGGFRRSVAFTYAEQAYRPHLAALAAASADVVDVGLDDAAAFIASSELLELGAGFLPQGWAFHPFRRDPAGALRHMRHILGVARDGRLAALLCAGLPKHGPSTFSIDFLEGEPGALPLLAAHALHLAAPAARVEAMVPPAGAGSPSSLAVLTALGLQVWNEGRPDVFVYERDV